MHLPRLYVEETILALLDSLRTDCEMSLTLVLVLDLNSTSNCTECWLIFTLVALQKRFVFFFRLVANSTLYLDFKKHGFDLEKTRLFHFQRLSRLTLAVAFLYVWLVSVGTKTIHSGDRHIVDRKDRRDLCIFQIGLRFIERCLTNALEYNIPLCLYR